MEYTREQLKEWFETGDKPTGQQFADFINSVFNLLDDGGAKAKQLLEALTGLNRLTKSAVRGADFALNRRGKGNVLSPSYQAGMTNILAGDFWIYYTTGTPGALSIGDWVVALRSNPSGFFYDDGVNWEIIHFGDSTINQQTIDLQHYRYSPTSTTSLIVMQGITAEVIHLTINKLTYYGKEDDGSGFGDADFVYRHTGGNTEIVINDGLLGFEFDASMVIDVLYKNITS